MAKGDRDESAEGRSLRRVLGSARHATSARLDRLTGAEYRQQFEEFTSAVTTTVIGLHRDQSELGERLTKTVVGIHRDQSELGERLAMLEDSEQATPPQQPSPAVVSTPAIQKLIVPTFIFSLVAVVLGVIALVVAV